MCIPSIYLLTSICVPMYIDMCIILIYLPIFWQILIYLPIYIGKYMNIKHISIYIGTHIDVSRYMRMIPVHGYREI